MQPDSSTRGSSPSGEPQTDWISSLYRQVAEALAEVVPRERIITDPLRTLAYGTDASFYRLIPRIVIKVETEAEVQGLLKLAHQYQAPLTFRAAGTSLSGQAISDSLLVVLSGESWREYELAPDAETISLQPGIIGARANEILAPFHRKIGPDPASINAAKIGGIAANNASGMCCGTAQNSYHTLAGMRLMLANGARLDTRDPMSVERFRETQAPLLERLSELALQTRENSVLAERIRHKYRLKNTTGYSLNALIDFTDPIEILQHLMIGSEGTLGFISQITYRTVPEHPCKATALVLFPDIESACRAVVALKSAPVAAVELMDRAALGSVQEKPDMPEYLQALDSEVAALLVDLRAEDGCRLEAQIEQVICALDDLPLERPAEFTRDPAEYQALWNIRKGLFPAVGAVREVGTTVIIEDVAFPVEALAAAVRELQGLFDKYHYHEALIFGHALEGNLHFVFTQDFASQEEIERYQGLMDEVCRMVVDGYAGSLKAEHGTGRNMAPYVEMEWGSDAYRLMWELKHLLDPEGVLNPGVILNQDPEVHLKHLKPLPAADETVDRCIECGFCEAVCPSRNLTLTPRQRIVSWREIVRLQLTGEDTHRHETLSDAFTYQGLETCAVDGLCAQRCPVGIDTGLLTRKLRQQRVGPKAERLGHWINNHFARIEQLTRAGLRTAGYLQGLLGTQRLANLSASMRRVSGNRLPLWNSAMPGSAGCVKPRMRQVGQSRRVVYFPSCVSRTMGVSALDNHLDPLHERVQSLIGKAGFELIIPAPVEGLCCGMPFASKGLPEPAQSALDRLEKALWDASEGGVLPIICDTSPCTLRMLEGFSRDMQVYEVAGFIHRYLMPRLQRVRQLDKVALHITCTSRKMGLEGVMHDLAAQCAEQVIVPEDKGCCGFAGDKGFTTPELNASALKSLRAALPADCRQGVSNSRTCEIGLSHHGGISYRSIAYLVDECFEAAAD